MKILHVTRQFQPCVGGLERFVAELAGRLKERGHGVEVATLNRCWRKPTRLSGFEIVNGLPVHRLPFLGGPLFFFAPGVLSLVKQFDLIHIHNTDFFLDFLTATRFSHQRPLVVSTHGGFFHTPDQALIKRLYFSAVTRHSLGAVVVIPNSASDERRFAPYARRATRIDNAIDYAALAIGNALHLRQPVTGRIITVGRLAPNKNIAGLLRAFAHAHASQPHLSLVIVGDGQLRSALEQQAVALNVAGAVRWTGEIDEASLRAELLAAEVFASASTYEAFGLAVLEGMAAGLIAVVNDIEAFRDVVTDRVNGFLTDYAQPEVAAQALLNALSLPDKPELQAAATATAAKFDWPQAVGRFEAVYEEAIHTPL